MNEQAAKERSLPSSQALNDSYRHPKGRYLDLMLPQDNPPVKWVRIAFLVSCVQGLILARFMPVFHQEAYYFLYSQHPALSYYDHPPMGAWLIWLGTNIFGFGAFGLRFMTWLLACGSTLIGLRILHDRKQGIWAQYMWVIVCMTSPLIVAEHFHAGPDTPLVFFWMLSLWALLRARDHGQWRWWLLAGAAAGCALLSKYTALFLGLGGIVVLLLDPMMRRQLRTLKPWVALLLALCLFSPVVVWNAARDWASFSFQTESRFEGHAIELRWIGELVGLQFLVINPLIAIALPFGVRWAWRIWRRGETWGLWLIAFGLPMVAIFGFLSLWTQIKVNWLMPIYPALLFAVLCAIDPAELFTRRFRLVRFSRWWLAVFFILCFLSPLFDLVPWSSHIKWAGWYEIAEHAEACEEFLDQRTGDHGHVFFFSSHYSDAAQLGRNLMVFLEDGDDHHLEPTLARNVFGIDALQFDYWTPPESLVGFDAVLVLPDNDAREKTLNAARKRFVKMDIWNTIVVRRFGAPVHTVEIYACYEYKEQD